MQESSQKQNLDLLYPDNYFTALIALGIRRKCFLGGSVVKSLPATQRSQETQVGSLGWEDSLEEATVTHSSILAWRIPRTEEPGGLPSTGTQRVRHD